MNMDNWMNSDAYFPEPPMPSEMNVVARNLGSGTKYAADGHLFDGLWDALDYICQARGERPEDAESIIEYRDRNIMYYYVGHHRFNSRDEALLHIQNEREKKQRNTRALEALRSTPNMEVRFKTDLDGQVFPSFESARAHVRLMTGQLFADNREVDPHIEVEAINRRPEIEDARQGRIPGPVGQWVNPALQMINSILQAAEYSPHPEIQQASDAARRIQEDISRRLTEADQPTVEAQPPADNANRRIQEDIQRRLEEAQGLVDNGNINQESLDEYMQRVHGGYGPPNGGAALQRGIEEGYITRSSVPDIDPQFLERGLISNTTLSDYLGVQYGGDTTQSIAQPRRPLTEAEIEAEVQRRLQEALGANKEPAQPDPDVSKPIERKYNFEDE